MAAMVGGLGFVTLKVPRGQQQILFPSFHTLFLSFHPLSSPPSLSALGSMASLMTDG